MTDEKLKQKCTERAEIFQQAMESCHSSSPMDCIEWFADRIAELEKENKLLGERCKQLLKDKGDLTDKVSNQAESLRVTMLEEEKKGKRIEELEQQIEKMKSDVISERDKAKRLEDVITYTVLNDTLAKWEIKEND